MSSSKVVLVTGCSKGGIGFHLCERFADQGCVVYATSRRLETMQGFAHSSIRTLSLDVTSDESVQSAVQHILEESGKIDIVVNNAGALAIGPLIEVSIDQVKKAFDTNTFSALRVAKAVIPSMVARKRGLVVNIGSIAGEIPTPWNGLYCAAKAALHSLSNVLAMECQPFGVDVMLVAPGGVRSNIAINQAATLELSSDSFYKPYINAILARMNISQGKGSMDTAAFAKRVVQSALSPKPPAYMTLGHNSRVFAVLLWFPRRFVRWVIMRTVMGKPQSPSSAP
ncbi:NAD(P)-binding protein [Leucogyrophana mollusca]|uniref:NAD(P)-binding protein n=1 Tax=Leucogyrophana mollusca TaxID=85980 RepID=A0ACB8BWD5_9AGAM|nr:NAD(P)-binding protein [Leucogyrophana mollusca]